MENLSKRKTTRLSPANYSATGSFFLTICTKNRRCLLSKIVGTGVRNVCKANLSACHKQGQPTGPRVALLPYGKITEKYIQQLHHFYQNVSVDAYVIMPNHVHLLLSITNPEDMNGGALMMPNGPSGTPVPTGNVLTGDAKQNSIVSKFISTFKRFCNKEYGENIWQYRSYDHIIRSREDYEKHLTYIFENPLHWQYDELFINNEE